MSAFVQITLDYCIIHLLQHHGDATPGSAVTIEAIGLDAYHAAHSVKGQAFPSSAIEIDECGLRTMTVPVPGRNKIRSFGRTGRPANPADPA